MNTPKGDNKGRNSEDRLINGCKPKEIPGKDVRPLESTAKRDSE